MIYDDLHIKKFRSPENTDTVVTTSMNPFKTDAELVRDFNIAADQPAPEIPQKMSREETFFLVKMIIDEVMELCATVAESSEYKPILIDIINKADNREFNYQTASTHELVAEQADAVVDMYYYSLNAMVKKGVNISKIFKLVHEANMMKKDPETGKFIKRDDGKIMKPDGWKAPDIVEEIKSQQMEGPWS